MRVTQQLLYNNVLTHTNSTLSKLMELNIQSSSQKRINKPSDDPNGAVTVLQNRTTLSQITQYKSNITQAQGWLAMSDSTLTSINTNITTLKGLAEQGATGTVTSDNREQISYQVRQIFEQLISQANTQYNGQSLYAGHKTNGPAFEETLWLTSNDGAVSNASFSISGGTNSSVLIQFVSNAAIGSQPGFRYSSDGGQSWQTGTYGAASGGRQTLQLGSGLTVSLDNGVAVKASTTTNDANGTWLWVRPTAKYLGDDTDSVTVDPANLNQATGTAAGTFAGNVTVRLDGNASLSNAGGTITYSYSLDGGNNWVTGNTSGPIAGGQATLSVPGGLLTLSSNAGNVSLRAGEQYFLRPAEALIEVDISPTDSVVVNGVGKDIFGGVYNGQAVTFGGSDAANLFETVGKLIGYLETNNQQGCQEALDNLTAASQKVLTAAASVGAKENRVTTASTMLDTIKDNTETVQSRVEDADLTELMTQLAQQELAYQAVLKSSSMLMNLSLVSYI